MAKQSHKRRRRHHKRRKSYRLRGGFNILGALGKAFNFAKDSGLLKLGVDAGLGALANKNPALAAFIGNTVPKSVYGGRIRRRRRRY